MYIANGKLQCSKFYCSCYKTCSLPCSGMNFSVIQSVLLLVLKALWNIGWVGGTSKMTCDGKET